MNIKQKILSEINKNKEKILGVFAFKDEYLKIFNKMDSISKDLENFKIYPEGLFEDFDYEIYTDENKDCFSISAMTDNNISIPDDANIIYCINGLFSKKNTRLISDDIEVINIDSIPSNEYYGIERQFIKFYDENENQLSILNSLLAKDGLCINIAPNANIAHPIYLINIVNDLQKNYFINSRKLIKAGENSFANIIEVNLTYSNYNTIYSELFLLCLEGNSNVNYSKMFLNNHNIDNSSKISYIKNCGYSVNKNANLNINTITVASAYNKNNTFIKLEDANASLSHSFLGITTDNRIIDLKTTIYHKAPNTQSNQLIKAVANDNSKMYFDGKIIIENDSENVSTNQNSKAILISNEAEIKIQPQLEIHNDNIKASHGSAIGNLDNDLLFYLQSRGIDNDIAKKLLLIAFASDIISKSKVSEDFKNYAINEIENAIKDNENI